ncbi:MAG: polysaccharide biosynthesis C-terminal domain-containing protein, partial [Planctomycetota bacterium]|nr:polysaccharide biosynthesis C-terminal domain-containing protein [Planctomycetota bacterium]
LKWTKVAWSITILSGLYLLVLGPNFLSLWFRDVYHDESGELLQVLMVSFLFFYPVRAVALPLLMGIGHAARPALALLLMGILNVGISLALIEKHGLMGVALGTAIPNALFAAAVFVMACREVQLPVIKVLSHTLGRSTLGALPVLGLLLWIERYWTPTDVPSLLLSGLATLGLFGIVWVGFVYRNDPHINLSTILTRQTGETDTS